MIIPAPPADLDAFNLQGSVAQHLQDGLPVNYRSDSRVNYRGDQAWVPELEPWVEVYWAEQPADKGEMAGLAIIQIWYDPLKDRYGADSTALAAHVKNAFFGCDDNGSSNKVFPLLDFRAALVNDSEPQQVEIDGDSINIYAVEEIPSSTMPGVIGKKQQKKGIQINLTIYQWMPSAA